MSAINATQSSVLHIQNTEEQISKTKCKEIIDPELSEQSIESEQKAIQIMDAEVFHRYNDMNKLFNFANSFNPDQPNEKTRQALIEQLNRSKIQVIDALPEELSQ